MEKHQIEALVKEQKSYFELGQTLDIKFRIENLKKLRNTIKKYEKEIMASLYEDLGKSDYESYMCEIGMALSEITFLIKNTKKLSKEKRVKTPLAQFSSKSYTKPSPYGNTLIMSPWNYPFLLTIDPLADAIAAGNTAIVKPSAYSPKTSELVKKIIEEIFEPQYVAVVTGGRDENACLLEQKFDFIFFTGSSAVGKEVLRHAAENLTPTVLELGGKILDVAVEHELYGQIRVDLMIETMQDAEDFVQRLLVCKDNPLKVLTDDCHYHTVAAPSEKLLDLIQKELEVKGYLL